MSTTTSPTAQRDLDGLAVIGRTKHALMGIRYAEGEGGDDAAAAAKAAEDAPSGDSAPWTKENFDPDRAGRLVDNLRKDIDALKTKQAEDLAAAIQKGTEDGGKAARIELAKLLAGESEPETDPTKLNEALTALKGQVTDKDTELSTAQQTAKASNRALQVAIHSPSLGGNAALLLANEKFTTSLGTVEPTDEAAIKAAITQALQDNAALKATPSRSGSGEHQGATVQSLEAQLVKAAEAKDFKETIRLKRAISAAQA